MAIVSANVPSNVFAYKHLYKNNNIKLFLIIIIVGVLQRSKKRKNNDKFTKLKEFKAKT
jgi:hypothetical protein